MIANVLKTLVLVMVFINFSACSHRPENEHLKLSSISDYNNAVELQTQKSKVYDGFMNVLDVRATLINTKLAALQVDQNARIYLWNEDQYKEEIQKSQEKIAKETAVFLSFFVPDKKYDDLSKANTKWRIFLDTNGRRVEGHAIKQKLQLADLQNLYPQHTRWHSAYMIYFPISIGLIDKSEIKMTITGPLTSTSVTFSNN